MDDKHHDEVATPRLNAFKRNLFGRENIVLHTADFTRNKAGFEAMASHDFRLQFFTELQTLIRDLDFKVAACAIKKQEHLKKYGLNALDPYLLSLSLVIERFVFECGSAGGTVVVEARDETLNNALNLAFLDLKIRGTTYVTGTKIQRRVRNSAIRDKKENIAGLQVADVVATPIARHALGKATYPQYCSDGDFFAVVRPKFRQSRDGKFEGMGLVVLPK